MTIAIKSQCNLGQLLAIIRALYEECYYHTTLTLNNDDADKLEAKNADGELVFEAHINTARRSPCVTLKCWGEKPFTFHTEKTQSALETIESVTSDYASFALPETQTFEIVTINVPEWFADPEFSAWLDSPEQNCMTYHRHGKVIGEFSDVLVLVDGLEGDSSDIPETYWRQVVQTAKAYNVRGVRLTNMQE